MSLLDDLLDDLRAEGDALRGAVAGLDGAGWAAPTPASRWSVATQVAHLLWTDEAAVASARSLTPGDETGQEAWDALLSAGAQDPAGFVDHGAEALAQLAPVELLARWDASRTDLAAALHEVPAGAKMPWFGPPMSPASMVTARFMETWAHALDVYDALRLDPVPTDRIRHVAHLGVRTRDFAYSVRGRTPPAEPFRIELTAPSGAVWTWGPDGGVEAQQVSGSAYDFCLLVTQRIHRDDTDLVAIGDEAEHWLGIAQAFAGPAGEGRKKAHA